MAWLGRARMLEEQVENLAAASGAKDITTAEKGRRERSTIQFPYGDLDDASSVARAIHEHAGTSCSLNQLAAYLKHTPSSSALRLRVTCARVFGLVTAEGAMIRLTDIGKHLVDPHCSAQAKTDAFLQVPLYAQLYKEFDGYPLPPAVALERKMHELGVSSKQTNKARQAFERSARQAGFFAHGPERLVMPAFSGRQTPPAQPIVDGPSLSTERSGGGSGGDGGDTSGLHPLIQGLIKTLPPAGTPWKVNDRVKWLRAASYNFELIYEGDGSIRVDIEADS